MTNARRLELQKQLERYFEEDTRVEDPSEHVSFQPDENSQIKYPHIVYSRKPAFKVRADNIAYFQKSRYEMTYIDRKPESPVVDELKERPYTSHDASFVADGLHHDVFDLYY